MLEGSFYDLRKRAAFSLIHRDAVSIPQLFLNFQRLAQSTVFDVNGRSNAGPGGGEYKLLSCNVAIVFFAGEIGLTGGQ